MAGLDLAGRWPLTGAADLREALLAAYAEPTRHYHDQRHLSEVLDRLEELHAAGAEFDSRIVALAAWFHDGIYDGQPDAERRSAQWAEQALPDLVGSAAADEVGRLVRVTQTHTPGEADANGQALCDADLAILAAGPERYADYAAGVRREYAHVSDAGFALGRAAVLRALLDKPTLFHTAAAQHRWEAAARANVAAEVERLRP